MCPFLRALDEEERREIERLAHSRAEQARLVERAQIVWRLSQGAGNEEVAREMGLSGDTVRQWLRRFNASGVRGLRDKPRPGKPPLYTPEQVAEVITAALTPPKELDLPFGAWTLDRLAAYLDEVKGIPIKRSRIDEILLKEGLRWRHEETWFSEKPDPDFAAKRGPLKGSTKPRPRAVSSSV